MKSIVTNQTVIIGMKQCIKCGIVKELSFFALDRGRYRTECKECRNKYAKEYHQKNRDILLKKMTEYREKNKHILYPKQRECRKRKPEQYRLMRVNHYLKNREKVIAESRKYRKLNKDKITVRDRIRKAIYRKTSLQYKIKETLRSRFFKCLKKGLHKKSQKTLVILGCSISYLIEYLEKQFKDGMTWQNYGKNGWHIDHIRPCSSFDLSIPEEQQKCFHYSNLQPLWAKDNLEKGCKYQISENKC